MNFNLPPTALKDYAAFLKSSPDAKAAQIKLEQRLHSFRQWSADRLKQATRDDLVAAFFTVFAYDT